MAKPDPLLLNPARYPFHCEIGSRFGDMDTNQHLNNVALASMFEDARVRFHRASGYSQASTGASTMIASFAIEYMGQAFYPDPLTLYAAVEKMGRTSYTISQFAMQNNRPVAYALSVVVCVRDGQPVALPEDFTTTIQAWMPQA